MTTAITRSRGTLNIWVNYSLTNAQVIVLKNNIETYIKIAPTCFAAITPSSGSSLSVFAKVTL